MELDFFDKEMKLLKAVAGKFHRHPLQRNQLLESDAEVIDFQNQSLKYLVLKTDGIHEEIKEKLYEDPYLIGWMAVTVTISDLVATGALPLGLLLTLQMPREKDGNWLRQFQTGVNDACEEYEVYVLGGDTNFDPALSVATTGVGTIQHGEPLSRNGVSIGDLLYATSLLGLGNAFAYAHYFDRQLKIDYKPVARLKESKLIKEFATCCIDTSDGLLPALSVLSEINNIGFEFARDMQTYLHADALKVSQFAGIPSWMLLAGPHGEYELLFTIPLARKVEFEKKYGKENAAPVYLGKVNVEKKLRFFSESLKVNCHPAQVPNLFHNAKGDVFLYFELLKQQHKEWQAVQNIVL